MAANLINGEIAAFLNKNNMSIANLTLSPLNLAKVVDMINKGKISNKQARTILEHLFIKDEDSEAVAKRLNMVQISDEAAILALVNTVLDDNLSVIEDYKNGKDRAFGFLVGLLMKKSQGKINPSMASKILKEEIEKR
jgi:aspartyl-tRNA(Asn)/glutamyl-tRNA(Gln) amidotransferase subunit B